MTLTQGNPPAGFRKQVLTLLGEGYGDKTLVLCPTVFVKLLNGDHKAAILLSQILYWSDRTKDPDGWFYKSFRDWHEETGLSEYQVRRIVHGDARVQSAQMTLHDLGVETKLQKVKRTGAPTLHYRINREQFLAVLYGELGQGDPQQCSGSILDIPQDQPLTESGMYSEKCAPSSLDPETNSPKISVEEHLSSNPAHHPDEDSDLGIFLAFEGRFGKVKEPLQQPFRAELARLGATKVREVLERCATRGRSWSYVAKALTNETVTSSGFAETPTEPRGGGFPAFENDAAPNEPKGTVEAVLPVSNRLQTPWEHSFKPGSTVAAVWEMVFQQLAAQLDTVSFQTYLRDAVVVDFLPETQTFQVAVRTVYARDLLQGRLYRTIRRILVDIYQQPAEVQFVLRDEWIGQGKQIA